MAVPFETTQSYASKRSGVLSSFKDALASLFNKRLSMREHKQVPGTMATSNQNKQPSPPQRIAIIGGGIGGLALATFLSNSSRSSEFDISIYESKSSLTELGAGVGIWLRTWNILASAGLAEDLKQVAPKDRDLDPIDDLQKAFEFRRGDYLPEGHSFYNMEVPFGILLLHRADFQNALARHAIRRAEPHFGKKLVEYEYADENDPSSEIILKFADGSTSQCDLLVGADGIRSVIRREMIRRLVERGSFELDQVDGGYSSAIDSTKLSNENVRGRDALVSDLVEPVWSGTVVYRSLVPLEALERRFPCHRAGREPVNYFGKSRHVVAYPIRTNTNSNASGSSKTPGSTPTPISMVNLSFFVSDPTQEGTRLPQGEAWLRPAARDDIMEKFRGWEEEVIALLELAEKPLAWAIHTVKPLPKYSDAEGRVVILGDAAHAMEPHQGAGGGQAIEDAYVLATLLTHSRTTRSNMREALRAYDAVRVPVSQRVMWSSRLTGMVNEFNHAWDEVEDDGVCKEMSEIGVSGDVDGNEMLDEKAGVHREDKEMARLRRLADVFMEDHKWVWEEDAENQVVEAIKLFEGYLDK